MEEKEIVVKVTPAAYDLGQGLRHLVGTLRAALADGFQPGQDVPVIVSAVVADLIVKVGQIPKAGLEVADVPAFTRGIVNCATDIAMDMVLPAVPK